jgi:hypothetical protein
LYRYSLEGTMEPQHMKKTHQALDILSGADEENENEAKTVTASETKNVAASETKKVAASETKNVTASETKKVAASETNPPHTTSETKNAVASEMDTHAASESASTAVWTAGERWLSKLPEGKRAKLAAELAAAETPAAKMQLLVASAEADNTKVRAADKSVVLEAAAAAATAATATAATATAATATAATAAAAADAAATPAAAAAATPAAAAAAGSDGAPAPAAYAGEWRALDDVQGRTYYYNTGSGVSTWEKPPGRYKWNEV